MVEPRLGTVKPDAVSSATDVPRRTTSGTVSTSPSSSSSSSGSSPSRQLEMVLANRECSPHAPHAWSSQPASGSHEQGYLPPPTPARDELGGQTKSSAVLLVLEIEVRWLHERRDRLAGSRAALQAWSGAPPGACPTTAAVRCTFAPLRPPLRAPAPNSPGPGFGSDHIHIFSLTFRAVGQVA